MKKLFTLMIIFLAFTSIFAQMPGGMPGGARTAAPNMGHIYGKIIDADGKGISDASVMIMQKKFDTATKKMKEVLLKGLITKNNGSFNFEDLPLMPPVKLKISRSGYAAYEKEIAFIQAPGGG